MAYTQEELDIADHPLFQRLRYIYQTGVLYLVAHAATHRRFEHSLGVVATAQKLLNALWDGSHRSASKLYTLDRATRGQAVRFDAFPAETRAKLQRLTRLCALVHDLGHGPLSHTFDAFAPRTLYLGDLLLDERLAVLRPYLVHTQGDRLAHEVVSCLLFAKIWHDLGGEPWVAAAVACVLLEGREPHPDSQIPADVVPLLPLVTDIVSSAPVDADRMDYLLRDSRQLGVNYGNYEQGRLLKSALCAVDRRFPADTLSGNPLVYRLGWRQSGLGAIENFIVARSFMFREMYAHKTYRAFELMLKRVAEVARTHEIALIECRTLDGFAEAYCRLTDDVFLRILTGEIPTGHALPEEIRELASCVMARHPWKRVYDVKRSMRGKEDAILAQLRERWPGIEFLVDRRPTRATKDLDRGSRLYDLNGEGRYSRTTADAVTNGRSWLDESAIIEGLHRDEVERLRLYAKKVSFTKEDRDMASAMRLEALKIAASL
jgi:HD superfamily phosphohydrolase